MNEGNFISGKREELQELRDKARYQLELLDEIETKFRKTIETHIRNSDEFDGTGNVWINSFALLEDLELSEWNDTRVEKVCKAVQTIKDFNNKDVKEEKQE